MFKTFELIPKNGQKERIRIFSLLWLLTFIIYLPAAKAGWVIDASWMVYYYRQQNFFEYINRAHSPLPSLYQFTQIITYIFLKVFDTNVYAWHLLHVTLHAVNCLLLYTICKRLLWDTGIETAPRIALKGVVLFTICPHISEVLVWEASYHYLQGFLLILVSLWCVQQYHYKQQAKYAWLSGILYFLATYSLEIFYLTPWFILFFTAYYRYALGYDKAIFMKVLLFFFVPTLLLFFQHLAVLFTVHSHFAHLPDSVIQPISSYLCKPPKFFFHVLLLGRYFPEGVREYIYTICEATWFLAIFYGLYLMTGIYLFTNRKKLTAREKPGILFFGWILLSVIIIIPLPFPLGGLLMFYDRYLYLLSAFAFMQLAFMMSKISSTKIRITLLVLYAIPTLYCTMKVNLYWKHSAYVTNRLLNNIPTAGDKTIILLNVPENMKGIAMIGAQPEGEFKQMRETFVATDIPNIIYDAASFNMVSKDDGAYVKVLNDSTIQVTLAQWGTWWWYEGHGGKSYETEDYKLNMTDVGHQYELTLKHPHEKYLLLFEHNAMWKTVNMANKESEQH